MGAREPRDQQAMVAFDETVDTLIAERRVTPDQYDDLLAAMLEKEDGHDCA